VRLDGRERRRFWRFAPPIIWYSITGFGD
jgi:hypothetical protein